MKLQTIKIFKKPFDLNTINTFWVQPSYCKSPSDPSDIARYAVVNVYEGGYSYGYDHVKHVYGYVKRTLESITQQEFEAVTIYYFWDVSSNSNLTSKYRKISLDAQQFINLPHQKVHSRFNINWLD